MFFCYCDLSDPLFQMAGWEEGLHMAVATAMQTGVLGILSTTDGLTSAAVASHLELDPRATGLLLDVLAESGYAEKTVSDPPVYTAGQRLEGLKNSPMSLQFTLQLWSHMGNFLRTGAPFARMDGSVAEREHAYGDSSAGLAFYEKAAANFVDLLPIHPRKILDVGCGSGVWSLAFAQRFLTLKS